MTVKEIKEKFKGKLIGRNYMQNLVCETLSLLPDKLIIYVAENVWFMSSFDDAWAFTFEGKDLRDKHLIFLTDELFEEDLAQKSYTILHEIGHVILKHRNAIFEKQTPSEITRQEKEADQFAKKHLNLYQEENR